MAATTLSISRSPFLAIFLLSVVVSISAKPFKLGKEKMSHIHFYLHDIISGPNPTAVEVVTGSPAAGRLELPFGSVVMIDDPLTEAPDPKSKLIGRAQGLYAQVSVEEVVLFMALNYVFLEGKYNGSTLSILGRNAVLNKVREMPVLSGSGLFRFARGYAVARTHSRNMTTGDSVVEYNVYVTHY